MLKDENPQLPFAPGPILSFISLRILSKTTLSYG
jgi:hypothetical protein